MIRKQFLTLVFMSSLCMSVWAQATQPCIVKQYNQKLPKTPLAGVEVGLRMQVARCLNPTVV